MNSNKLVFVTGAGRGIGRAISVKLAELGYIVSGSSRTLKELEETKKLSQNRVRIATVDATDPVALEKWIESEMAQTKATPWGLVVSAGTYGVIGPFVETPFSEWEAGIKLNLISPALTTQLFARHLITKKLPGRIVLLSGGGATQPLPNFSNYCAAKSAIVRFAETIAYELKPYHITVNTIAPGAIATKFVDDVLIAGPEKAGKIMYEKALKQKKEPGVGPEKAADLAAYLLSEETSNVSSRLISAIWDNWPHLHEEWDKIEKTDWYTLKRSTPN